MLRCYHFGNFYTSSIQQGIQAAHAQMELFVKYQHTPEDLGWDHLNEQVMLMENQAMLYQWASQHKTMICLNGGDHNGLTRALGVMEYLDEQLPWASFYEEPGAISEHATLTNVCVIVPEKYYTIASKWNKMLRDTKRFDIEFLHDGGVTIEDKYEIQNSCSINGQLMQLVTLLSECRLAG